MHSQANTVVTKTHAKSVLACRSPPTRLNAMDACGYAAPVAMVTRYFAVESYAHGCLVTHKAPTSGTPDRARLMLNAFFK